MIETIAIALAPVVIILLFIYFKDKWEKEPFKLLFWTFILGCLTVIPVLFIETFIGNLKANFYLSHRMSAIYDAFFVAGFTEEAFKFLAFYLLIWRNKHFNEKFDGIVYAVFISLGFAAVENIMYVSNYGISNGLTRAFTAVPAHALFGVSMGYYFAFSKFSLFFKKRNLAMAFLIPFMLHGIYDFILMSNEPAYFIVFIAYLFYLWKVGFKRIKELSTTSRFRK